MPARFQKKGPEGEHVHLRPYGLQDIDQLVSPAFLAEKFLEPGATVGLDVDLIGVELHQGDTLSSDAKTLLALEEGLLCAYEKHQFVSLSTSGYFHLQQVAVSRKPDRT